MAAEAELETYTFSADISQLMGVIVKAVYSNKEIFLRELISNASDALERRRCGEQCHSEAEEYYIRVVPDAAQKTLTVEDCGIGMTREELIESLGTVARSKTKAFMETMASGSGTEPALIGQFGIGFYSAYCVADKVCVVSRSAASGEQCIWESAAGGSFTVAPDEEQRHGIVTQGTKVVCFLKEDQHEFLDCDYLKELLTRHSCFVKWPLYVPAQRLAHEDAAAPIWERINSINPIWLQRAEDVSCEEYSQIYSWLGHGFDRYLAVRHVERNGQQQVPFKALLFCSGRATGDLFDLIEGRTRGAKIRLFVRGVFVKEFEDLLPKWMCFMKGIVESDDLPLNISRERLQKESSVMRHIAKALAKESFDMLAALSSDSAAFRTFHDSFGQNLKLGIFEDVENRPQIIELLRYHTTMSGSDVISLREYVLRMDPKQKHILFVTGRSHRHCLQSPLIEGMLRDGREVILMGDPADEFAVQVLKEYQGTELVSAGSAYAAGAPDTTHSEPRAALQRLCLRVDELLDEAGRPGRVVFEQKTDDPFPAALREAKAGSPELVLCSGHGLFRELAAKENLGPLEKDLVLLMYDLAASLALGRSSEESERRRRLGERLQEMVKLLDGAGRVADEEDMPSFSSAEIAEPKLLGRQSVPSREPSVGSLVRIMGGERSRRAMVTCVDEAAYTVDVLFCSPPDEEQDGIPMASAIPLLSFEVDPDGAQAAQLAHEFADNFLATACCVKDEGNTLFKLRDFEAAAEWYSFVIDAARHRRIDAGQVVLHAVGKCQLSSAVVQQCSYGVCSFVGGGCCDLGAVLPVLGLQTLRPLLEELLAFRQFSEPVVDLIAGAAASPALKFVSVQAAAYTNRARCRSELGLEREAAQDLTVALGLWRALGEAHGLFGDAAVVRGLCKAAYLRGRTRLNRGFAHAAMADVQDALRWDPPAAVRKQLEELQGEALLAAMAERHRVREPLAKELAKVTFALRYAAL